MGLQTIAKEEGFTSIVCSHEMSAVIGAVERGDTTLLNAYLTPKIQTYITTFLKGFLASPNEHQLLFMQSDGGLCTAEDFNGANAILSGPAGGVSGVASMYQGKALIGFDMGGTSSDVCRYDGEYELNYENTIDNINVRTPQLDILTVAAGGGSRLFYENGMLRVGPESAGAHPGPICYRKDGHLSVTDANVVLGRIQPEFFPHIFGPNENEPLDKAASIKGFEVLLKEINHDLKKRGEALLSLEALALGFLDVANDTMMKPIRNVSLQRGFELASHELVCFGGAGAQHACAIARALEMKTIHIHRYAGILSAYGIGMANILKHASEPLGMPVKALSPELLDARFAALITREAAHLIDQGLHNLSITKRLGLRFEGSETVLLCDLEGDFEATFYQRYQREFGFVPESEMILETIEVRICIETDKLPRPTLPKSTTPKSPKTTVPLYFDSGWEEVPLFDLSTLEAFDVLLGPAIVSDQTSTIVIEPHWKGEVNRYGDLCLTYHSLANTPKYTERSDAIWLAIFGNLFSSIAERMGTVLKRTAISTNIKERLDFSCAIFDQRGDLIANAPHVPVHLGSMSYCVKAILERFENLKEGDVFIGNSPLEGGSHLPDITLITPKFHENRLAYFVANRGHHADVGGITPGSMPPFSQTLQEEGTLINLRRVVEKGVFDEVGLKTLFEASNARRIDDNIQDIKAQISANKRGIQLLDEAIKQYGLKRVHYFMESIQQVSERSVREFIEQRFKTIILEAEDFLDDGTPIALKICKEQDWIVFDFVNSGDESVTNQNTPESVVASAVVYALRLLIQKELPLNGGFLRPIKIKTRKGSLLNPSKNAAVVGGNVTTSQRIVDVILQAFGDVADSCGCMNNVTFGNEHFGYYETVAGGSGAGRSALFKEGFCGADAVHTHMTNTRITDPEILERRYPVVLEAFGIRADSGGVGEFKGGNGVIRRVRFLEPMTLSVLSERRRYAPKGVHGGGAGALGENWLIRGGERERLSGKFTCHLKAGECFEMLTAGGGGYGNED